MGLNIDDVIAELAKHRAEHGNVPVYFPKGHGVTPVGSVIVPRGTQFVTFVTAMKS